MIRKKYFRPFLEEKVYYNCVGPGNLIKSSIESDGKKSTELFYFIRNASAKLYADTLLKKEDKRDKV
jgi:hypothetical protein